MPTEPASLSRHPWLELLLADPEKECKKLLDRVADVGAYSRAEPHDILRMLVGDLDGDDPIIMALDKGFLAWLEAARQDRPASDRAKNLHALKAVDAFRAISAVSGPVLLDDLWKNYIAYYHWADSNSTSVIDLRYEFLSMLSQSQARLREAKRDRTPMWLTLCGNAGRSVPDRYLDIGLIGLRRATRLPPAEQEGIAISPEEYGMIGLGKWVENRLQRDVGNDLARKWAVIKLSYPHTNAFWKNAFERLLLPRDPNLTSPVLKNWAGALGFVSPTAAPHATNSEDAVPELKSGQNWKTTKQAIYIQIAGQIRRVMSGGPTRKLAIAVTKLGNDALHHKSAGTEAAVVALELAMVGLTWEPQNAYCWSLWRDALATAGDYAGAETIGLEGARRNPGNPAMWTGLTKLWMSRAIQRRNLNGGSDEEARSLLKRAADVLGNTWQRSGNAFALTMGATALSRLGDAKTAKKLLQPFVDKVDIANERDIPKDWNSKDVAVVRNLYSKFILLDRPGLNEFREVENLTRDTIVYSEKNNISEQIEFAQSILIRALIGINEPSKLNEAIDLCRILNTEASTELLGLLEREAQGEPSADGETNMSNLESSVFGPEFESGEGEDDVEFQYSDRQIGGNTMIDAANSLVESVSIIAAPLRDIFVSKAIAPTDSKIDAGSSLPSVGQSLPSLIGSLDPDFQSKSRINVESLSYFSKLFARAIDPDEHPYENNEWDAFTSFMLKGFQPWNSVHDPSIGFPSSTTSFALALTSAIHLRDREQMMRLADCFPQEDIVCKLAVARANSDPDAILKIVASHKRQANAAGSTLGSASRAVVSMITKDSVDAFMGKDDQILPLALASTFDIPLAA